MSIIEVNETNSKTFGVLLAQTFLFRGYYRSRLEYNKILDIDPDFSRHIEFHTACYILINI